LSNENLGLPKYWQLCEEARESWDYFLADELVHIDEFLKVQFNPLVHIAKCEPYRRPWLEVHILLGGERKSHYAAIIEFFPYKGHSGGYSRKQDFAIDGVQGDMPMFLDIPKRIESPHVGIPVCIPVVVRLKRLHEGDCLRGDSFGGFLDMALCAITVLSPDREANILGGMRDGYGGELPCQIIERGSQTANEVSGDQRKRKRRIGEPYGDNVLSALQIVLREKSIGLRVREFKNAFLERVQVYLRPSHLQVRVHQIGSVCGHVPPVANSVHNVV
jgi:hypothetical protein